VKIGIVSQSYYPRYGGVTEHVHHTALELRRRGHQVTIITSRFRRGEAPSDPEVERIGYNLLIPFNGAFVDLAVGIRLRSQLRGLLKRHRFDILHTHAPLVPTLPLIAVETAECPQVGTFHTTSGPSRLIEAFLGPLAARMKRLDARIAVSETARDFVAQYFPGDYHVIPNGVDTERFHPSVEPFPEWRDPRRVNVLFVGRLDPRKGVQVLLDALPEVIARTQGKARLLVVGDSYLRGRFEASVAPAARAHVHFVGHVPSRDLPRWYATGDIFVSPALGHESFGIVLAEAMAAGRAVVASDIPGYRSVVQPGVNGVVSPPGDVLALAGAIAALVEDPERRAALAQRGRARALEFAWPHITDRIEAVYRDVLARRGAAHRAA
jgi:phosphatidyl-myo-inositol alpha-mannosyltransferase